MSLHKHAKHLAAQGRGPDTELVHMTSGEVAGLQALARAGGGSLTINPKTGLPEAGFLSAMLPTVIGFAVGDPMLGAALGAGTGYMQSGTLMGGLMGGLGGYGGGSMAANFVDSASGLTAMNEADQVATAAQTQAEAARQAQIEAWKQANPDAWGKLDMAAAPQPYTPEELAQIRGNALQDFTPRQLSITDAMSQFMNAPNDQKLSMLKATGGGDMASMAKTGLMSLAPGYKSLMPQQPTAPTKNTGQIVPYYSYNPGQVQTPTVSAGGADVTYFQPTYTPMPAGQTYWPTVRAADGGLMSLASGGPAVHGAGSQGPVESMSDAVSVGQNTGFPQAYISKGAYATPWQTPISRNMVDSTADTGINKYTGELNFAAGGLSSLGGYSDGGRLLRGPGDGVSDSIPAVIGEKQPARLADGEFVVPARIVSELGNGSTEAGARQLYKMMDRVQAARAKTTSKGKVAKQNNPQQMMPA